VSDIEAEEVARGVSDILALIDKMQSVDTDNVEPLAHPFDAAQKLRPDVVTESDRRDELQQLAPQSQDGLFLVPKVIE
jgi:aspartyl-tRNA(Asn)/glutamyl-tRNA(Gln) amidotransferase subunit C